MKEINIDELIKLRKILHQNPELSGNEKNTSEKIKNFVAQFNPDEIIDNIGGNGIAFIFKGNEKGKIILFRSELDALPISEQNSFEYKSLVKNVSHKCGHDGHMAILAGLASSFKNIKPEKGAAVILFQPAEETGEGANAILRDDKFSNLKIDYVFALHNIPGYPLNSIIIKDGVFASASKGIIIKLHGKTSHASQPENGISPAQAAAEIIQKLPQIPNENNYLKSFNLITIVHARIGEVAFGTAPGYAEVMATLRSFNDDDMKIIKSDCEKIIYDSAKKYGLKASIEWTEEFPSAMNESNSVSVIKKCAQKLNLKIIETDQPFRWSEDFGHFTKKYKGALIGIGSGEDHSDLHNPDYDFPDEIIEPAINLFKSVMKELG